MAHVELSLSEAFTTPPEVADDPGFDSFQRWVSTVSAASEPCLLIDIETTVMAISVTGCDLLCLSKPLQVVGLPLLHDGLRLLDFTAARAELTEQEVDRIPPLLALTSGRLARGLLRVMTTADGATTTVDAISTPVLRDGTVAGSLTFLSPV